MTREELMLRQLTNQYLIRRADKMTVVRDLCGVQAQFMSNAIHALRIRCQDFDEHTAADGLVKNWTIRGTVHVFAESDLPLFLHCADGKDYRKNEWSGFSFWNQRDKWGLTPARQKELSEVILAAIEERPYTRDELKTLCRTHGMTDAEESCMFDPWGGGIRQLCERGFMNYAVQEKKAYVAAPAFSPIPEEDAKLALARRYFTNFAPATVHDAMYFFGAKQAEVKAWLTKLPVESCECEGKTYFYIPNGKTYDGEIPPCLLLAGFDQLLLGYQKKESLYVPDMHIRKIFNLAGIVMPTVLLHGKAVGTWKKKGKKLSVSLFASVNAKDKTRIENTARTLWQDVERVEYKE